MIFYMLFLTIAFLHLLKSTKRIGIIAVTVLGVFDTIILILPIVTDIVFYDTWIYWAMVQILTNTVLLGCLIREFIAEKGKARWNYIGSPLSLPQ